MTELRALEYDLFGMQKHVWKIIINQRNEIRTYFHTQKILLTEWTTYFAHPFDTVQDDVIQTKK